MLKVEAPDRFRVDFSRVKRASGWRALFTQKNALVDAWAIGKSVNAALARCPFRSATGVPQVWNEYALFLAREDHDRLRPVESSLQRDLGPMLYEELVRLGAVTVGALVVRLLVDDADEVQPGSGILRVRHVPDAAAAPPGIGEMTVRLDRVKQVSQADTQRVSGAVLRTPGGDLPLAGGVRHAIGRAHPDAAPDHLALPGAGPRINRRQATICVEGDGVEVAREPGDTNPVSVAGRALGPGERAREKMPVDIQLSGGEMKLTVQRTC